MPPQDRVRCDDARNLLQDPSTQPMPTDRQPASIVIGELEPLSTQLASKDPIFFHQIRHGLGLLAIQPASQDGEYYLESGRVEHDRSLYQPQVPTMSVDPVMGYYALSEYAAHYHHERNHQGLGNTLIDRIVPTRRRGWIRRRSRLGGLLNYYERAA